jgi:hypothetical protein
LIVVSVNTVSDATFSRIDIILLRGDGMKQNLSSSYRRAGTVKRQGSGIILELPEGCYYLTPEDTLLLRSNKPASIIDGAGEIWGCAWLSPIQETKKKDIVATIRDRIYVVSLAEAVRLLAGSVHAVALSEYRRQGRCELMQA